MITNNTQMGPWIVLFSEATEENVLKRFKCEMDDQSTYQFFFCWSINQLMF